MAGKNGETEELRRNSSVKIVSDGYGNNEISVRVSPRGECSADSSQSLGETAERADREPAREIDELTGLLSRRPFYRHVREVLDSDPGVKYVLVRFDLNRFKVYNDMRGMAAGDQLLCGIAAQLRRHCKTGVALCSRLESDHFAMFLPDEPGKVRDLMKDLAEWITGHVSDFHLSSTFGVYPVSDPSVEVSLMCDRALLALLSVKGGFRTRIGYYDDALREKLLEEQLLVSDLDVALREDQFELYFQPQINYEDNTLIGAEALVRWNHPRKGRISPGEFIPLFEKNGLILRLDQYVWDRACRYIRDWMDNYPGVRALSLAISVNVSRMDIYDGKLCETLLSLTEKYWLPVSSLRLEITESAYMEAPRQLMGVVRELQRAGFTVEMDDFGSGYSSLNTLKDVPVDVLKLDMKFLDDCEDRTRSGNILSSVIRMAHWLKLPIIAEGVETKNQAEYLKSLGCVYMQGYYFSRPMPAKDFEKLLTDGVVPFLERYKDTNVKGIAAFWNPSAQLTLLFNSFVGGAAIMEFRNGLLEISRANDSFYKILCTTRAAFLPFQTNMFDCYDAENGAKLLKIIQETVQSGEEGDCELRSLLIGGEISFWIHCRMRLLARSCESALLYVAIENIMERKLLELEQNAESERRRLLMQTTGMSFFSYDFAGDEFYCSVYLPKRGVVRQVISNYYNHLLTDQYIDPKSREDIRAIIRSAVDVPERGELEYRVNRWNSGMRWYRAHYVAVKNSDGRIYRLVGHIDDIQDLKDRAAISAAIGRQREAGAPVYKFNDQVVNQVISLFYDSADLVGSIETVLALLGTYYDLSRAYIFEDGAGHRSISNTFEWCAAGVEPQKDFLQKLSYDLMGGREGYVAKFDEMGCYYCPDVSELSETERATLEPQGIFSMLHYAIWDNGVFNGMIGFDECRELRRWTDEQVGTMMFVSRIVASYVAKLRLTVGSHKQ